MSSSKAAAHATQADTLNRNAASLLGVYGPDSDLRAMVRMPGGQIRKVRRGSSLPAGRIVAIDAQGLILEKGGATLRLVIPGS